MNELHAEKGHSCGCLVFLGAVTGYMFKVVICALNWFVEDFHVITNSTFIIDKITMVTLE